MNNKPRNWIMLIVTMIEIVVVAILILRIAQTCCSSPAADALPTLIAFNTIPAASPQPAQTATAPRVPEEPTSTPIPETATTSNTPTITASPSRTPMPPTATATSTPSSTPTTQHPNPAPTSTPAVQAIAQLSTNTPVEIVIAQPTLAIPTVLPPTAVPPSPTKPTPTVKPVTPTVTTTPTNQPSPTIPVTPSLTSTASPTSPTSTATGQCSWAWATKPLPEISEAAQLAITNIGLTNVTVRSEAFGETCHYPGSNEPQGFSAMETNFYLIAFVADFSNKIGMAQIITTSYNTITTLNVPLPARLNLLDIEFTYGDTPISFQINFDTLKNLIASGASPYKILAAGGIH